MLKGRILGIFCWICLFSEWFLSIRDVVWLWAFACRMAVDFACRKAVDFACRKAVGFCLFLSLFLRDLVCWRVNIVCSKRESSLLEKRKQLPGIDYNYCLDRWSKDLLM